MSIYSRAALIVGIVAIAAATVNAQNSSKSDAPAAIERVKRLMVPIVSNSYPELSLDRLVFRSFESQSVFFKACFSLVRFLTFRSSQTIIYVNPAVFDRGAPESGLRGILAHELAHALYYTDKNRLELIGLVRLANMGFTARFERRADLVAIDRGFGNDLLEYRRWLYKNLSARDIAAKERNYFTPDELMLLIDAREKDPETIPRLLNEVPGNIAELRRALRE